MSIVNSIIDLFLWLYIHGPIYQTESFIDDLQITPNPDSYLTPPSMIRRYGYPIETYSISTSDGFILAIDRIPNGINNPARSSTPILLIHGFLDTTEGWIVDGPDEALAYLLSDQGYDIWMVNTRGNTYSRGHTIYTPQERAFWNYSFHEIGIYDIPATIDFILKKTNQKQLLCIGDSAGNVEFYIMSSVLPQYGDKVIAQISLAPYYHESCPNYFESFLQIANVFLEYLYQHTAGGFLEQDLLLRVAVKMLTTVHFFGSNLYNLILIITNNGVPYHANKTINAAMYNSFPAGGSIKETQHVLQMECSFSYFDYGKEGNLKTYGTVLPPKYNISNIRTPIRIYRSSLDEGTNSQVNSIPSVSKTRKRNHYYNKLPRKAGLVDIQHSGFSHLDFMIDKNVKKLVYNDVIQFINNVLNKNTSSTT